MTQTPPPVHEDHIRRIRPKPDKPNTSKHIRVTTRDIAEWEYAAYVKTGQTQKTIHD